MYDYCLKEHIADQSLIAKWKKQGYENLCCLRCIQTRDTNFGTNCICRVPKAKMEEVYLHSCYTPYNTLHNIFVQGKIVECVHCGCRGCSGWSLPTGLSYVYFFLELLIWSAHLFWYIEHLMRMNSSPISMNQFHLWKSWKRCPLFYSICSRAPCWWKHTPK